MTLQHVLITGANRGIGLAFVEAYLASGARVFAGCRTPGRASDLARLKDTSPHQLSIHPLDVRDDDSIAALAKVVSGQTSRLDRLVNNAAVFHTTPLSEIKREQSIHTFEVNSVGPVLMFQAFLPILQHTSAVVVNISSNRGSVSGQQDNKLWDYAASKAALNSYTRSMAAELRPYGAYSVALDPGWVQTRMGGADADLTPAQTVAGMVEVVEGLTADESGGFFDWDGSVHPW